MPKKDSELRNEARDIEVAKILALLTENDFDLVGLCASNKITYPIVDSVGNERDIVITISIPTGARDGEGFDGQAEILAYGVKLAEKEQKAKEKAEKKERRE